MSKRNISTLKAALTSGSHGRRFSEAEEGIIVTLMTKAKKANETVSVAAIKKALTDHNLENSVEPRKRAAVVNAIERLAKTGKVDKAILSKESNGREPYTDAEDEVLIKTLTAAEKKGEQVSIPELHKALKESGVSPKERSVPSVRAHITNMFNKAEEGETETEDETEIA